MAHVENLQKIDDMDLDQCKHNNNNNNNNNKRKKKRRKNGRKFLQRVY